MMLRDWWVLRAGMRVAAYLVAPRQPVGAVGVVRDEAGQVLLVEHVFRTDFPWGLPGGYVRRGEDPRHAVSREISEELGLQVEVGRLLLAEPIGLVERSTHPRHMGLAYECRLRGGTIVASAEVVSCEWVQPSAITRTLAPFQRRAIESALAGGA
jgi:ADP-ribose pyrophosphatase YjhB (NUDIX family)